MRASYALILICTAGCIPAVPFVTAETADTLKRGDGAATVYGGGGYFTGSGSPQSGCCAGAMGRLRVGIGHDQEVGAEGGVYVAGDKGPGNVYGTTKLRWKMGLGEHIALIAGAGLSWTDNLVGVGADFGGIASTKLRNTRLHLYSGLRGTMVVAADSDVYQNGGISGGGILPFGIEWRPGDHFRLDVEVGAIGAANVAGTNKKLSGWFGGYGALALSYAWSQ
jgi:hypothetical protein